MCVRPLLYTCDFSKRGTSHVSIVTPNIIKSALVVQLRYVKMSSLVNYETRVPCQKVKSHPKRFQILNMQPLWRLFLFALFTRWCRFSASMHKKLSGPLHSFLPLATDGKRSHRFEIFQFKGLILWLTPWALMLLRFESCQQYLWPLVLPHIQSCRLELASNVEKLECWTLKGETGQMY